MLIIGFFTCGCTHENICNKPLDWNGEFDTKEYKEYIFDYTTKCQINPAIESYKISQDTLTTIYKFHQVLLSDYYNDILDNPQKIKNETTLNMVIGIFGATSDNVLNEYAFFQNNPYIFHARYNYYFEEVQKAYTPQQIYNKLNSLISYMDSQGYLDDYRVVDMLCCYFESLIDIDIDRNLPVFEPLIFKVALKNQYKDNTWYDGFYFGGYYFKDKNHYTKYR